MELDEQTRSDALKLAELALDEDLGGHDLSTARDCTTLALVPEDWDARDIRFSSGGHPLWFVHLPGDDRSIFIATTIGDISAGR